MGYTHYWRYPALNKLDDWYGRIEDCDKIVEASKAEYALDPTGNDKENLWFNGSGGDDYEDFVVPRLIRGIRDYVDDSKRHWPDDREMWGYAFCKTGGVAPKPYDDVVVACLCVLAEAGLIVTSDGDKEDWEAGRALAERVLGRSVQIPEKMREAA